MAIQIYKIADFRQKRDNDGRGELCAKLGLDSQLCRIVANIAEHYEPLGDEEPIWRRHLPTAYRRSLPKEDRLSWTNYCFDIIPVEALREMEAALPMFPDMEIWSPEKLRHQDPLVVGISAGKAYKVVRWAESLLPFDEIKRKVVDSLIVGNVSLLSGKALDALRAYMAEFPTRIYVSRRSFWGRHCGARVICVVINFCHWYRICQECGRLEPISRPAFDL